MLLLYAALAALWHRGPHLAYFTILRLFGFEPFRFPFLDIHAVLAAVQCHHLGIDVYSINPCDALDGRMSTRHCGYGWFRDSLIPLGQPSAELRSV